MFYYSRFKMLGVLGIVLISLLLCVPNFIKMPFLSHQVHLGLDLRGGSYLLLELDTKTLQKERLSTLEGQVKQALIAHSLGFVDEKQEMEKASLSFLPRSPSEKDADLKILGDFVKNAPDEVAILQENGRLGLKITEDGLKKRAREAVSRSIEIVRHRVDSTGALDPTIAREGDDRIILELPGVSDPEHIKTLLGTTARMTFHLVYPQPVTSDMQPPPGVHILSMKHVDGKHVDGKPDLQLALYDQIEVDGADLSDASAALDSNGGWVIHIKFDNKGTEDFARITAANIGKPFAIVLDNQILTAPTIQGAITAGTAEITGNFDAQSATNLATLLRAGALPAPLSVIEQRTIGPSLGKSSILAGMVSLAVGFLMVVIFMVGFYGRFGLYADIALFANLVMILAILSLFEATLTLPGMAGILLTLGMAVDANILINERVREEVKRGRNALEALQIGFERATSTIIDSNATAFLAHVMLFVFGTGPVRNFALTITIGIVTTLFTTLVISRLLIIRWYALKRPKTLPV